MKTLGSHSEEKQGCSKYNFHATSPYFWEPVLLKVIMQGKLFQWCMHLLYCSVMSLGGNVNTTRLSKPDMGSIFHIKNQWNILVIGNNYVNYQNYQNLMLLTSSDTKRTLMHTVVYKFRPERTGFNMYAECPQLQLTFLALVPWFCSCIVNSGSV